MTTIPLDQIQVGKRLRMLREATVLELMDGIQQIGLQTPVSVVSRPVKREGGGMDTVVFDLVAGRHRLEACRRLGWAEIEVRIVQMSKAEQELWEIDENLCRADLTELERGEHLLRRKSIYESWHPETRAVTERGGPGRGKTTENFSAVSFAADTAAKAGLTDRTIRQSIKRVRDIDEKVRDRIRDNPEIADSGVELDALAAMDTAEQRKAVALVEAGQAVGIRDAKKLMEPKPVKVVPHFKEAEVERRKRRDAFVRAWNVLDDEDREWARGEIMDKPVADNATALRVV